MKIGVLTSSRADYGIYLPLLNKLKEDKSFQLEVIAFGTHMSKFHGYTVENIYKNKYNKVHEISTLLTNDDSLSIATAYGLTVLKFADFWGSNTYDLVLCLGDRFEMSAAVQAGIPYGVKFAHIHGGETTLGAIDNIYRHQITMASSVHFTSTKSYKEKVIEILGNNEGVFDVGALSLNEINDFTPIDKNAFYNKFGLNIDKPFALVTFHPETVSISKNASYAIEMKEGLAKLVKDLDIVITMPNADTQGTVYRDAIFEFKKEHPENITLIENFGKENYFTAMYYAQLLVGNTSSGIIEAASLNKYVVNVGDRQKGRIQSENTLNVGYNAEDIYSIVKKTISLGEYKGVNVYFKDDACDNIVNLLKKVK